MDSSLNELADKAIQFALTQGVEYCDARAETQMAKSVLVEDGEVEHSRVATDQGIGFRLLKNGAWGFYAVSNPESFEEIGN
jgi:TldD protein